MARATSATNAIMQLEALEAARSDLHEAFSAAHIELCSARRSSSLSEISLDEVPQELTPSILVAGGEVHVDVSKSESILKWFGERPSDELRMTQTLFRNVVAKCMAVIRAEAHVAECT